jgi:hypothetical protein
MRKCVPIALLALICVSTSGLWANPPQQGKELLRLVQTIPLPNVKGRFDHMDVDVDGKRLVVVTVEGNSMEVVDLGAGKWIRSIPGFKTPTEPVYAPEVNKLFVVSRDGTVKVFRRDSLDLIDTIKLELGSNRAVYDPVSQILFVRYGGEEAGFAYSRIGLIDTRSDKLVGDIVVNDATRASQILRENATGRLFAAIPERTRIDVYGKDGQLVLTWPTAGQGGDMALDQARHRLFVGIRNAPQRMIVYDSDSGQEVANLPAQGRMNGVYYDARYQRIYVTCGRDLPEGFVFVYQQKDADHYEFIGKVPTGPGAGTSYWVSELNRFYVVVPASEKQDAKVLIFEPQP